MSSKSDVKKKKKETKSLFASQICVVMVIAVFPDGKIVILWTNEFVNSIHGHVHLRHFYGKETEVVSTTEGVRLEEEEKNLSDLEVPDTDIKVKPDGYPSLTDGTYHF